MDTGYRVLTKTEFIEVPAPRSAVVLALREDVLGTKAERAAAAAAGASYVDGAVELSSFRLHLVNHVVRGRSCECSGASESRALDDAHTVIRFHRADYSSAWIIAIGILVVSGTVVVLQWPEIAGEGEGYFMPGMWPVMLALIVGVGALATIVRARAIRDGNAMLRQRIGDGLVKISRAAGAASV